MAESCSSALYSPDFKRITGKLRTVKRRKRSSIPNHTTKSLSGVEETLSEHSTNRGARASKNPFRSLTSSNIASPAATDDSLESDCFIPRTPEKSDYRAETGAEDFVIPSTPDYESEHRLSRLTDSGQSKRRRLVSGDHSHVAGYTRESSESSQSRHDEPVTSHSVTARLPPDYSICTKMRLTSHYQLPYLVEASEHVMAEALQDFITNNPSEVSSTQRRFHRHVHYYMYPNMPWLSLYPRKQSDKLKTSQVPPAAYSTLDQQWRTALRSAYHSLVFNQLPCGYFYMLCEGFTVLFSRCVHCGTLSAVASPTARGFRQNLQARGISFTLPLLPSRKEAAAHPQSQSQRNSAGSRTDIDKALLDVQTDQDPLAGDDDVQNDSLLDDTPGDVAEGREEDPLEWLEGMGLQKSQFPSLRPTKVQMEEDMFRQIDYRPASTVLVTGVEMLDKLRDSLTDYNKTVASTGQLAHVPPTIVSRSPFVNATIEKLQLRTGQVLAEAGTSKHSYIDLIGPVLPGLVEHVMDIVRDQVPADDPVCVNMVKQDNTHVYNVEACDCSDGQSRSTLKGSFIYQHGKFYGS